MCFLAHLIMIAPFHVATPIVQWLLTKKNNGEKIIIIITL
jgi:hypothetical protein